MLDQVKPELPVWVLNLDLEPRPVEGESFRGYCTRIGLDPDEVLVELKDQTAPLANCRLAHALRQRHHERYQRWLNAHLAARIPLERRKMLRMWSENVVYPNSRRNNGA